MSTYKDAIFAEIEKYKNSPTRILLGLNPNREFAIEAITRNSEMYDLFFLLNTLTEAKNIDDINSDFRKNIGNAALTQLLGFCTSSIELTLLIDAIWTGNPASMMSVAILSLAIDKLENYL